MGTTKNKDSNGTDQIQHALDDFQKEDLPLDVSKREDAPDLKPQVRNEKNLGIHPPFEKRPGSVDNAGTTN